MQTQFSWSQAELPLPQPLREAVVAGIFGVCADGSLTPNPSEVRAMTEEQACELLGYAHSLRHLKRCLQRHLNPHTSQHLRSWDIREKIERSMQMDATNLEQRYSDCLAAYADAFGDEAAGLFDIRVRELLELPEFAMETIEIQQSLF